jgi:integrase
VRTKYVLGVQRQIQLLIRESGWATLRKVSAESFRNWRSRQKDKKAKTLNEYLTNVGAFFGWLENEERSAHNPVCSVRRIENHGERTRQRRSLTHEEAERLISLESPWASDYWIALETGLRRGEVEQLEWRDLRLELEKPFLCARSATTKDQKGAHMPLSPALAGKLQQLRPERFEPKARVFARGLLDWCIKLAHAGRGILARLPGPDHHKDQQVSVTQFTPLNLLT